MPWVEKKDGASEVCVDWRKLRSLFVLACERLGDLSTLSNELEGTKYFTQLDVPSVFHQVPIAEADQHKTAFRDSIERLFEIEEAALGLTVSPAPFSRLDKGVSGDLHPDVVSWLADILTST